MKMLKLNKKVLIALTLTASLTACGRSSIGSGDGTNTGAGTIPGAVSGGGDGSILSDAGFIPKASYSFAIAGQSSAQIPQSFTQGGQTYTNGISTDSILKIRVTAGAAGNNVVPATNPYYHAGTNFTATYGCISYVVTVGGQQVRSQTLAVPGAYNYNCPNAPQSQVIDFSSQLTRGHGPMFVTVSSVLDDYYCQQLGNSYNNLFCPLHPVYDSNYGKHSISGTIEVETNGAGG